jgi:hypothetical protein
VQRTGRAPAGSVSVEEMRARIDTRLIEFDQPGEDSTGPDRG